MGEVVVIERGGSPRPIEKYVTESNDGLNWIKIGDAPVQGRYITKTSEKIKESGLSKTRQVFPGDLILSNSMSFGKPYIMGIEGCIHDGWLVIKNKNNVFDLKFLCHMLSTEYLFNQYKMFAAGSTVNNLNKELVGNASVRFPKMLEQKKIGQYLESLDHLITLHQSKSFGHILKAIVSCTLSWEQRKLGEVTTSYSGGTPDVSNCEYYGDEIPFIRSGEINNFHTDLFITEKGLVNSSAAMVKEGDILYALYGATSGEVSRSKLKGAINQAILAILPKAKYDSEYIAQWLKTKKRYIVDTYLQGGQGNLSGNIVKDFIVDFSSYNEQLRIGNFASSLDHLITLHQLEPFQLIFKAIAYRIIDYAKSKPPRHTKYEIIISFIKYYL